MKRQDTIIPFLNFDFANLTRNSFHKIYFWFADALSAHIKCPFMIHSWVLAVLPDNIKPVSR